MKKQHVLKRNTSVVSSSTRHPSTVYARRNDPLMQSTEAVKALRLGGQLRCRRKLDDNNNKNKNKNEKHTTKLDNKLVWKYRKYEKSTDCWQFIELNGEFVFIFFHIHVTKKVFSTWHVCFMLGNVPFYITAPKGSLAKKLGIPNG